MHFNLSMLAQSDEWVQVVIFGVVMALSAAGWLGKTIKEFRESSRKSTNRQPMAEEMDQGVPVDDLAVQRRRQLEERARQKQAAAQHEKPLDQLTMAERIRRARQQAESTGQTDRSDGLKPSDFRREEQERYERQRSEQLKRQQAMAEAEQKSERERERQRQLAQRRKQAELRQLQQQQQQKQQQQQARQTRKPLRANELGSGTTRIYQSHDPQDASGVHRHVPDALTAAPLKVPVEKINVRNLDRAALRQAVALKEILDLPVALRDPAGQKWL